MAQADLDAILKEFLEFGTIKSDINDVSNNVKLISAKVLDIEKRLDHISRQMLEQNGKLDSIAQYVTEQIEIFSEQTTDKNAMIQVKTEQPSIVQADERNGKPILLSNATGRYREIISLLINEGFFTYSKLAGRLNISQSRVRAYIADLKKYYSVPIASIKDGEGVKVGISPEFVNQILGSR